MPAMSTAPGAPGSNTADVYISGGAARSTGNLINLQPAFAEGGHGLTVANTRYTHIAIFAPDVDVRDAYNEGTVGTGDVVYVPQNSGGTPFRVVFVERVGKGTSGDHKRVYLNRQTAPWPTNNL